MQELWWVCESPLIDKQKLVFTYSSTELLGMYKFPEEQRVLSGLTEADSLQVGCSSQQIPTGSPALPEWLHSQVGSHAGVLEAQVICLYSQNDHNLSTVCWAPLRFQGSVMPCAPLQILTTSWGRRCTSLCFTYGRDSCAEGWSIQLSLLLFPVHTNIQGAPTGGRYCAWSSGYKYKNSLNNNC